MKVIICGDRHWTDYQMIVNAIAERLTFNDTIIEGNASGADSLAGKAGLALGIPTQVFPANWTIFGRSAGPIRNRQMLEQKPNEVWAFHDNIETSKGTANMVRIAKKAGIPTLLFHH